MSQSAPQPVSLVATRQFTELQTVTDSSKAGPLISDDYFWDDALAFLQKQSSPNQNFLLPEELCSAFPQAFSYQQLQVEQRSEFDWALLHKGRLSCIPVNILDRICRSRHPVFANEVFVLFASPQISGNPPPLLIHSPHVKALFSQLRQRKLQRSLQVLSLAAKTTDRPSPPPSPLIERPKRKILNRSAFIPLAWAATSNHHPYANLGDALSPILVSALSGLPVVHRNFESSQRRLACVGTIAHGFKHGAVHVWGTGLDPQKNPVDPDLPRRHEPMDWEQLIDAIDRYWSPLTWSPEQFLDAFPLPLAFNPLQNRPFENRTLLEQIKL